MNFFGGRVKRRGELFMAGTAIPKASGFRVARVVAVNSSGENAGTVDIEFLDGAGTRKNVIVIQSSFSAIHLPKVDSVVLVGFSADYMLCYVVGYIPLGIATALNPSLSSKGVASIVAEGGEQSINGPMNQGIHMLNDGGILIDDGRGGYIKQNQTDSSTELVNTNLEINTEAGSISFGIVKRAFLGGFMQILTKLGLPIKESVEEVATEFNMKVVDYSDNNPLTSSGAIPPVVTLKMGNIIGDSGNIERPSVKFDLSVFKKAVDGTNEKRANVVITDDGEVEIYGNKVRLMANKDSAKDYLVTFNGLSRIIEDIIGIISNHSHLDNGQKPNPPIKLNVSKEICAHKNIEV